MDELQEELEQIAAWFRKEGHAPDSSKEAQLCVLWRAHQCTRSRLSGVTRDLDIQRSQHLAEMAEVRKSLEQIRIFTEHKDVLAQEIQDENDQLKDQLQRLISLQDAQISEVAKMLYQQGLTELIHSSPSEQVAYLLVERASLLEMIEAPDKLMTADGNTTSPLGTETKIPKCYTHQSPQQEAQRHSQSSWKRLFGLHKASQSKHIPAEARYSTGQSSSVERECSRLERDLEEGSRRLAMAHSEIRRLTDELESAHLTQRTYEPDLQAAQQEVEQLRQEVEKLKKYEMVELRKAKELNDRLDLEIRALRSRVRTLDSEKKSLQQMVVCLQKKVEQLEPDLQEQQQHVEQQLQTVHGQSQATELAQNNATCRTLKEKLTTQTRCLSEKEETVLDLPREVEWLDSVLQAGQQLQTVQVQVNQTNELAKSRESELNQSNQICRDLQNKISAQTRCLLVHSHKLWDKSQSNKENPIASTCYKENNDQDKKLQKQKEADTQHFQNTQQHLDNSFTTEDKAHEECPEFHEAVRTQFFTQDECETLKKEICETLKCLDKERSKYHEMKEKQKAKLCRAKQKFNDETTWRDEKIKSLERELSLCSHSLSKEKDLVTSITLENEKLLVERRNLLQQLNEEEHSKKDSHLTASLSKCRVDFLESENKKLGNKILHMSNQLAVLERTLQNMQALYCAEELKKIYSPMEIFTSLPLQTSSVVMPEPSKIQTLDDDTPSSHTKHTDMTSFPHSLVSVALSRSTEMGYLNLTSAQSHLDNSRSLSALSSSENTCS